MYKNFIYFISSTVSEYNNNIDNAVGLHIETLLIPTAKGILCIMSNRPRRYSQEK